jgi:hypothetical protein
LTRNLFPYFNLRFCCINQTRLLEMFFSYPMTEILTLFCNAQMQKLYKDECDHYKSFVYETGQGILLLVNATEEYFCLRTNAHVAWLQMFCSLVWPYFESLL